MEDSPRQGAPIDYSLLELNDDLTQEIGSQMESLGYIVLMPPSKLASYLKEVRKCSKKFFTKTSIGTCFNLLLCA